MSKPNVDVVELLQQLEREKLLQHPPALAPSLERPTIHWTELPASEPGSSTAEAWDFYRQEVGRLLAEGHEGKWVLIKGKGIIGIWHTKAEASAAALQRFELQPLLIQQVLCVGK